MRRFEARPVTRPRPDALEAAGRRVWFLDLDGTLVDSAPVHAAAFRDAIGELAPRLLDEFSYESVAGASTREVIAALGATGSLADRLIRRKQEVYRAYVDAGAVKVFPGGYALLDRLTGLDRTVYLVTSGSRESVDRVLAASSLRHRCRAILTSDDLPASKPDPAVYREACRRWAVDPDDVAVVEDSAHGAQAALGAGLVTFQVHAARPVPGAIALPDLTTIVSLLERRSALPELRPALPEPRPALREPGPVDPEPLDQERGARD